MRFRPITLLVLLFSTVLGVKGGQENPAQAIEFTRLLGRPACRTDPQSGQTVCKAILLRPLDTKNSKAGDHVSLQTDLAPILARERITTIDAVVTKVQSGVRGRSVLRIRIDKAVCKGGREVPIEATVVALVAQSIVAEAWDFPVIIADRFPHIPEDDERFPGDRKLSEDQQSSSPLDLTPDLPVRHSVVCSKKSRGTPCMDLLEARGIYGYKKVTLEPVDSSSPADAVLSSKKNFRLGSGTVLVLKVSNIP